MNTREPEMSPVVAGAKGLRTGWTTGTCASAAAKAATIGLVTGSVPAEITVTLPGGDNVTFGTVAIKTAKLDGLEPNRVAIVKDAGDDPDCTNGAHVTAWVQWAESATPLRAGSASDGGSPIELLGGDGVGTVTKPGLGLAVGGPAINSVPSAMIRQAIGEALDSSVDYAGRMNLDDARGSVAEQVEIVCQISVPGGQEMSLKTSNDRLGIVGGISILGTTGIVKPFSTASWRASVAQQVDVAAAEGTDVVVISTGSRSDRWAQADMPGLEPVSFIEVGDFTGIALRRAAGASIPRVRFVGMAGKIAKLADGIMMTHFHRSKVNTDFLAQVARDAGAPLAVVQGATETTTARHFYELCVEHDSIDSLRVLCELAAKNCMAHAGGKLKVEVLMVDFEGKNEICRG